MTVAQKLFFKYIFKNAEDEDINAAVKREKKLAKLAAARKAGKISMNFRIYYTIHVLICFKVCIPCISFPW